MRIARILPAPPILLLLLILLLPARPAQGERPYFVTYDHQLEEPGNLEVAFNPVIGFPRQANGFVGSWTEFEYGVKGWWTSEFYLDTQSTRRDSTIFTGFRWENRFRPLMREHWINPVLYIEYERISEADKAMKEIVGFGPEEEHAEPNSHTREEIENEIETKLILSSNFKGWNVAENFIAEKSFSNEPWEFGYAFGVSRPLALEASPRPCNLCRENFAAGVEVYGGLGDWHDFGFSGPSHYVAPVLAWQLSNGMTFRVSPGFGVSDTAHPFILRMSVSHEFSGFGRKLRQMFR